MIYECRLNRVRPYHILAAALAIAGLWLLGRFDIIGGHYWWTSSIGIALAVAFSYLLGNTKVRVTIDAGSVSVYHSGMVQANFSLASVTRATASGTGNLSRLVVETDNGSKYYIPCECFSAADIEALIQALRNR